MKLAIISVILITAALLITTCFSGTSSELPSIRTLSDDSLGVEVSYIGSEGSVEELAASMREFHRAYLARDRNSLSKLLCENFVWTIHHGEDDSGRSHHGVEGMLTVLAERDQHWQETRYSDIAVRGVGDSIFQTYRITGQHTDSGSFDHNAIDIYTVADGKICSKDSYWKMVEPAAS